MRRSPGISFERPYHSTFSTRLKPSRGVLRKDEPPVYPSLSTPRHRLRSRSWRNKTSVEAHPGGTRGRRESVRRQPSGSPVWRDFVQEHRRVCGGGPPVHLGGRHRTPGDMRPLNGRRDRSDTRGELSSRRLGSHTARHRRENRRPPLDTRRTRRESPPDD